jgi:ribose transport system substrate-binding protein
MKRRKIIAFIMVVALLSLVVLAGCETMQTNEANEDTTSEASITEAAEKPEDTADTMEESSTDDVETAAMIDEDGFYHIDLGLFCDDTVIDQLKMSVPPETITGKVGVTVNGLVFPYGAGEWNLCQEAADKYFPNLEVIIEDGAADPVVQTNVVDDFIQQEIDVLVIDPVEPSSMVPAIERAIDAGITIVFMDRWAETEYTSYVRASDINEGYSSGKYLCELIGGKGNIVEMMGTLAASNTLDRHEGFMKALEEYPDVNLVDSQTANFNTSEGMKLMYDWLQKYPKGELDGVYSHSDTMTLGAIQAIEAEGRDELFVTSIDCQQASIEHIRSGAIDGITVFPVPMPAALVVAAKILAGEEVPEIVDMSYPLVTKENVDIYDGNIGY